MSDKATIYTIIGHVPPHLVSLEDYQALKARLATEDRKYGALCTENAYHKTRLAEAERLLRHTAVLMREATDLMVPSRGGFVPGGWADHRADIDAFLTADSGDSEP